MRAVRQHDGVARQLDAGGLARELHDVLLENVRLALGSRQKNLIAARRHGIGQRLAREVPGGADLAGLEDGARTLVAVAIPNFLVIEERILEGVEQLDFLFFAEIVARRLLLRAGIAVRQLGVEIDLVAARLLIAAHARRLHDSAHQQVNFLVIAAALDLFFDQFHQAQLSRCLDVLDGLRLVPFVALFPAIDGGALDP
ncbi:hypothetical protein JAB8_26130 [Janthinobacterium sp. HH106]|nr:hypothetical protein JAB8_26130 [Janthinobacterium sp. HH106]